MGETSSSQDIDSMLAQLILYLQDERDAAESFRQACILVPTIGRRREVKDCQRSHEDRVARLTSTLSKFGGTTHGLAEVWRAITDLGGSPKEEAMVAALAEGEDQLTKKYRSAGSGLHVEIRKMIASELRPAQDKTYRMMNDLMHTLAIQRTQQTS